MRLTESDIRKDCAGGMVCLTTQIYDMESNVLKRDVIVNYIRYVFDKGDMFLDVRDMLAYRGCSGGKVMFSVADYDMGEDGLLCIFGKFMDIKGGNPHQTEYTRRLDEIVNTSGRYFLDIRMSDDAYVPSSHIPPHVKDIVVIVNPFVFAPWSVNTDFGTVV